ncbi:hypothetical protein C1X87_34550, partial [Pseudomonas sp. GP01-A14]
ITVQIRSLIQNFLLLSEGWQLLFLSPLCSLGCKCISKCKWQNLESMEYWIFLKIVLIENFIED